jgi:hypothetical protein
MLFQRQKPTWNLETVTFTESEELSRDHTHAMSEMSFSLTGNARPFEASCTATTPWTPPNHVRGVWYPCEMPETALPSDEAWFTYDDTGKIQINQTYTCWEVKGPTL